MNKRSVDLESAATIGKIVKAGSKKISLKKPSAKKSAGPAKKAATKKTAPVKEANPVENTTKPAPKPEPNKIASSGKAYQPTLPGMRNLKQFKDTSAK